MKLYLFDLSNNYIIGNITMDIFSIKTFSILICIISSPLAIECQYI